MGNMRLENWPSLLAEAIEEARGKPFAWGSHDCAGWAFTVAFRLRGEEPPEWVGSYETKTGGMRKISAAEEIEELIDLGDHYFGESLATPLLAQRGDLVFASGAFGICIGADSAHPGEKGIVTVPLSGATKAWRV